MACPSSVSPVRTIYGYGERIVDVRFGSRAAHLGLEPGDVLLSLNGYKLTYPGSWNDALSQALYNNNYIRLKIRDVRTGNIYFRETFVDYNNGPVEHYYKSNNYATARTTHNECTTTSARRSRRSRTYTSSSTKTNRTNCDDR